jgi:hypothetical protein
LGVFQGSDFDQELLDICNSFLGVKLAVSCVPNGRSEEVKTAVVAQPEALWEERQIHGGIAASHRDDLTFTWASAELQTNASKSFDQTAHDCRHLHPIASNASVVQVEETEVNSTSPRSRMVL